MIYVRDGEIANAATFSILPEILSMPVALARDSPSRVFWTLALVTVLNYGNSE